MEIEEQRCPGLVVLKPNVHLDDRGSLSESFRKDVFSEHIGLELPEFCQENTVYSRYGVIRGLHYQLPPYTQSKLIQVIEGEIYDIVLDLRLWSKTMGRTYGFFLSHENREQLLVPKGCAHGFVTLSTFSKVVYKLDTYYHHESQRSIHPYDETLRIDWFVDKKNHIISKRDKNNSTFREAKYFDDPKAINN